MIKKIVILQDVSTLPSISGRSGAYYPHTVMKLSISEIAGILGVATPEKEVEIRELLTDSRSLGDPGSTLFFAIPTAGNDGHRYMRSLYDRGVRCFVANRIPADMEEAPGAYILITDNTVEALQKIAGRRDSFNGKILAITGSRGKTTLKEWIFQLMEPLSDISRSPRGDHTRCWPSIPNCGPE